MRVISGSLRGRRLRSPDAGDLRIRPTADRAREALFSILQKWSTGGFLDLFGGTGAVAVEAWSRGYLPVVCVEKSAAAMDLIRANVQGTKIDVLRKDVRTLPTTAFQDQAVIFADPPYDAAAALWLELAPRLALWLSPEGVLIWETDRRTELPASSHWILVDSRSYGTARFHMFTLPER